MAKRIITKASKRRLSFFGPISIIAIIYFAISLLYNVYTVYDLTIRKQLLENSYVELQEQAEDLRIDIEKLNDPAYLANYAREHYLYSKDGEYIIQMGEDAKDTTNAIHSISSEIDRNYIIVALSLVMMLIFIYILRTGKKRKKPKK